ncbi:MAG: hypothetical protein NVSMB13_06210 [Mycobacteriales bacterium]
MHPSPPPMDRARRLRLMVAALLCLVAMALLFVALSLLPEAFARWQATGRAPSFVWPLLGVGAALVPAVVAAGLLVYEVAVHHRRPAAQ